MFANAVRDALRTGKIDCAVHSLKDLPVEPAEGIVLAAVPGRDDPRDTLVARHGAKLADLAPAARIGTGSPRWNRGSWRRWSWATPGWPGSAGSTR